jgi:hypothetical protein
VGHARARRIPARLVEDEDYQLRYERVAGIDVAKAKADVCTRLPPAREGGRRMSRVEEVARQSAARRAPTRRRPLDPGRPRQRLAARLRAPRFARRRGPGRVALPHRRRGIRPGPGVGPVRRQQTSGGIRTPGSVTRRGCVRPRQAAAAPGSGTGSMRSGGGRRPGRLAPPGQAREVAQGCKAEIAATLALTMTRRPGKPPRHHLQGPARRRPRSPET